MPPHLLDLRLGDQVGRQDAGRVARVDAGVLDVLHHAADHAARAVGDRVHVRLERILEEAVDQHRMLGRHPRRAAEVAPQRGVVVDDLHRAPAEHVGRPHQDRISDAGRHGHRLLHRERHAARRLRHAQLAGDRLEPAAVLRQVDRLGRRAEDPHALALEPPRQPERRLPAELHHHAERLLDVHDLEHVLERERLEVEGVRDVEVGGDRLGVRVDHHRPVAQLAERHRRAHAAVVELDALPDPVGPAAEDHDGPLTARAAPRSPRRTTSRGRAWRTGTRRRRCPRSCTPGGCPARCRSRRISASVTPRRSASWRSEKPSRFILRRTSSPRRSRRSLALARATPLRSRHPCSASSSSAS